jgi:ABC-2 type transport system ATP-binding protein
MIEVSNLTKRYARHTAVDGISFSVPKGEILGFLGPNGAGKTTTMRILTGFMPATTGTVTVGGYDVFDSPLEVKRRVGYLPETPPLYPDMSVSAYLDFVAKIKGVPWGTRRQSIDTAIEKCRVGDVRRTLIGKLSKGYRQRVGLAQAILHDPEVLILDEPTSGLDPKQILETRDLIKGLGGDHTVVLSTHILPEVSMTCGRVVIISKGRVVAEDSPDALMHRLKGSAGLRLQVRGAAGPVFDVLRGVPGVTEIRQVKDASPDAATFELEVEKGLEVRPTLARAVVEKGFDLLSLGEAGMSLEQIFLHLTTQDGAAGEGAAAAAVPVPSELEALRVPSDETPAHEPDQEVR